MKNRILSTLTLLALVAIAPNAAFAVIIDFEADVAGAIANGASAVGHPDVTFTDTSGSDLQIFDGGVQTDGQSLIVLGDDASRLLIDFAVDVGTLSIDFGNDDACCAAVGDLAWLEVYLGGGLVGTTSLAMNLNDIMDQTVSIGGLVFDQAIFWYGDAAGNAINLIEAVDNINYEAAAVPEPGTLALLGLGIAFMGIARKRVK